MAPRNPRLQKIKTIINKMNTTQENETQNSNICQLKPSPILSSKNKSERDPVYSIVKPASTDHLFANSSHACSPQVTATASYNSKHPSYNMHEPAPTDYLFASTSQEYKNISCSENSNDANATSMYSLRYRRVSCSSRSDDQSIKDFSPASDDDQEFVPPSDEEISDSEPDSFQKQSFIRRRQLLRSRSVSSKSDSSSSSSSSSDSSSSDSSSSESDVSDETPVKKKCIDAHITQNESLSSASLLIQLPVICPYSSTSEEDDELEVPVSSSTYHELTSDITEENNITDNQLPSYTTHDDQGEALSKNQTASEHLSCLHTDVINDICSQISGSTVVPPETNNPLSLAAIARNNLNDALSQSVIAESTVNVDLNDPDGEAPKTRRKRKRGSKKEIAQKRRNMGLQYTTFKNKNIVPERKIGDPCGDKCILKCPEKIAEQDRAEIFKNYWNMGSLALQREFIARHMTEVRPKYQYKKVDSNRSNKHAFYFSVNNEKIRVCKTYFKSTLDINDRPIRTVISKLNVSGIIEPDLRGKHENHGTKISHDLLDEVKRHINSIPRIESHFLRQRTEREYVDREYIDGGKTVTDLYRDYENDCITKGLDYVKVHMYRNVFNKEFNISFFKPKKDQCEDCVTYKNSTVTEKKKSEETYRTHLREKSLARDEKIKDKSFINETHIVACYDLQAVLPVPKGDVSTFYYKSKLNCLNFTICELKKDNTECYFWTEVEGERGANEIGTCVFKFIEKKSRSTSNEINIIFYSDNCCGQQKNQFVFSMYIYALKHFPNIQSITHKFLIKGHTQNENDSVHSTIERQVKKMLKSGAIYVPDQYIHAIKEAKKNGRKYCINEMSHSEFYNIKKLTEYKLNRNTEGELVKTGDIKVLQVEKTQETPNKVKVTYKTSYDQEHFKEVKLQRTTARPQLLKLYSSRLILPERKKKDLKELLQKHVIPSYYGSSYYNHIL